MLYIIVVNILCFLLRTRTLLHYYYYFLLLLLVSLLSLYLCTLVAGKHFRINVKRKKVATLLSSSLLLKCDCFHVSCVCLCKCVHITMYMCMNIKFVFVPVLVVVVLALCSLRNFLMFFWCSSFSTWKNLEIRTPAFLPFLLLFFLAYVMENVSVYILYKSKMMVNVPIDNKIWYRRSLSLLKNVLSLQKITSYYYSIFSCFLCFYYIDTVDVIFRCVS